MTTTRPPDCVDACPSPPTPPRSSRPGSVTARSCPPRRRPASGYSHPRCCDSRQAHGHLTASCVGVALRAWTRSIPKIDGELLGPDGAPLPFDRSLITPYVLGHSYAQRHADAGVPVDVLKQLLDHRSIETTLGYYAVTHKRKQQAIRAVGSLAIDASGNPSSFADPLAYERASVSVPFGNCTEPSNVKAGGGACPI